METTIKGVIVFDVEYKKYRFKEYLEASDFNEGVYRNEYSHYVLVGEHEITVDIPSDFDIIKPQLAGLDAQEKELTAKYKSALRHIDVQRNNLLAIEHTPSAQPQAARETPSVCDDDPNEIPL